MSQPEGVLRDRWRTGGGRPRWRTACAGLVLSSLLAATFAVAPGALAAGDGDAAAVTLPGAAVAASAAGDRGDAPDGEADRPEAGQADRSAAAEPDGGRSGDEPGMAADHESHAEAPDRSEPDLGESVVAAVYQAREAGDSGGAVAEAVRVVLGEDLADAEGLQVAQAVYGMLLGGGTSGSAPAPAPFADLNGYGWAAPAIGALAAQGVLRGTGDGDFAPDQEVTAAQLVTILARLLRAPAPGGSAAVPSGVPDWAAGAWAWAEAAGVTAGVQGLEDPQAPLTRAQAVALLLDALGLGAVEQQAAAVPLGLSGPVPSWAQGALSLARQLGLLQGSGGQVLADQPLTRAQLAVLLARLVALEVAAAAPPTASGSPAAR